MNHWYSKALRLSTRAKQMSCSWALRTKRTSPLYQVPNLGYLCCSSSNRFRYSCLFSPGMCVYIAEEKNLIGYIQLHMLSVTLTTFILSCDLINNIFLLAIMYYATVIELPSKSVCVCVTFPTLFKMIKIASIYHSVGFSDGWHLRAFSFDKETNLSPSFFLTPGLAFKLKRSMINR